MKGVMEEGNEIQFISSVNGYGVTDRIEKLIPNEFVLFRHSSDTQRADSWRGKRSGLAAVRAISSLKIKELLRSL